MGKNHRGLLISFEGPEGSGKSTQAEIVYKWLLKKGYETILTWEPGGTELGKLVRDILLNRGLFIAPKAEMLLYGADRAQHVEEVIYPALKNGKIVLCDRFIDSSLAYQAYARGLDINFVEQINILASGGLIPDLTLLFDLPIEEGFKRKKRGDFDRIERESLEFHKAVREGYLAVARNNPHRVKLIDASRPLESVAEAAISAVDEFLKGWDGDAEAD
ncbi:MAG TPA: dTMP kinase [Peptococcaceae bacterium]|nr:MAG: Thymidylate kinase [Clostridia bacterium 41_269]HBT20737.1 dTMP kinase [Peptococcaceae bacterium]